MPANTLDSLNTRRKAKSNAARTSSATKPTQPQRPTRLKPPPAPEPEPLMVRPDQAAKLIAIGRNAMYELLASGAIRSIKLGHSRLVPVSELRRWIAEQLEDDFFGGDAA